MNEIVLEKKFVSKLKIQYICAIDLKKLFQTYFAIKCHTILNLLQLFTRYTVVLFFHLNFKRLNYCANVYVKY